MAVSWSAPDAALACIGGGGVLVVGKLDQLGRTLPHLLGTLRQLDAGGAGFTSLSDGIVTTTASRTLAFLNIDAAKRLNTSISSLMNRREHGGQTRQLRLELFAHSPDAIDGGLQTTVEVAGFPEIDHSTLWRLMRRSEKADADGR